MTTQAKANLSIAKVLVESTQMIIKYFVMILILPLVFTPIALIIERAMEVVPLGGIHTLVNVLLNIIYITLLVLVHFAFLNTIMFSGSWKRVLHSLMLDNVLTLKKFLNYYLVNVKLMLVMLIPTALIINSYADQSFGKITSLALFLLACLLASTISAKFIFALVIQIYGAGTKQERSLRFISYFSQTCYLKLVLLEFIITFMVYIPKWIMAYYFPENKVLYLGFHTYLVVVLNFIVSIFIIKAYDQLYRKKKMVVEKS